MISGQGPSTATFFRHRSLTSEVESIFMGKKSFTATLQEFQYDVPSRDGCGWAPTFEHFIPDDWPSGIYSAVCKNQSGEECAITFVVRAHPERRARLAVIANVNTWLAYNSWGGKGKYGGASQVSFLRPNPGAAPHGDNHLTRGELWVLGWLEREGFQYDMITDLDFHNWRLPATQYRCLVLSTHPEYWTLQMHDNLVTYLNSGGSLAYLGGNGIFENGEYVNASTGMTFFAQKEGGPRDVALFRLLSPPRHERQILVVATERCGVKGSPYVVETGRSRHPLFALTGMRDGNTFGEIGLNRVNDGKFQTNGMASGWEIDTMDGPGAVGVPPANCVTNPDIYSALVQPSELPNGVVVLARGKPDDGQPGADMVCYDHPGGGFVFSVGSITFGGSLVVDATIRQIVLNVMKRIGVLPHWRPYKLALNDSASINGGVITVSRIPSSMEVWWVGADGSIQAAYWYENDRWKRYELAPAGSAAPHADITAVSRIPSSMEVWWVGGDGSIQAAFWYENAKWQRYELAPAGSAAPHAGITAVSRIPSSMEVWWVGGDGSIQAAFWYENVNWQRYELAPSGSASLQGNVTAVSRIQSSMEVWWVGKYGAIQAMYFYG